MTGNVDLINKLRSLSERITLSVNADERPIHIHWSDSHLIQMTINTLREQESQLEHIKNAVNQALLIVKY